MRRGRRHPDIESAAPTLSLHTAALRMLGRREYTAAELTARLTDRGYPDDAVRDELTRLREAGDQDDRRAAAAHVRAATRLKGRGRLRIERELIARGLDRAIVREALAEVPATGDADAIARVLERRRVPAKLDQAARQKIFQHLMRRGFPADAIGKALRSREGHEDE